MQCLELPEACVFCYGGRELIKHLICASIETYPAFDNVNLFWYMFNEHIYMHTKRNLFLLYNGSKPLLVYMYVCIPQPFYCKVAVGAC
jgi:hypothetical protein